MPDTSAVKVSVIVPVYNGARELDACLAALRASLRPGDELIVVDDASTDASHAIAEAAGAKVVRLSANSGGAAARNRGASEATGEILLFVDADVVVRPDTVARVAAAFMQQPDLAALFGSFDDAPAVRALVSQYRNLLHHYTHQIAEPDAFTFWTGLGAIRAPIFASLGGLDTDIRWRPIEDIELGNRLHRGGHRVWLDKTLVCTHLKRWTLASMVCADVVDRAAPWTRMILSHRIAPSDLNLRSDQRASVVATGMGAFLLAASPVAASLAWAALAALAVVVFLNRRFYAFLAVKRGAAFAVTCIPLHFLYFLCSAAGFAYAWAQTLVPRRSSAV
jgi:glycosyltransferase involved in cell wall biosynthesis